HHHLSLIQPALHDPLTQNKLTFKYIHPILLNSKNNNLKTFHHSNKITQQFNKPKIKHLLKNLPKFHSFNPHNPNHN
uniref:DnaD domain protein n=1 Tax=Staphylococcus epidermidis TaxID=1282 RepID=UPI0011A9CB1F